MSGLITTRGISVSRHGDIHWREWSPGNSTAGESSATTLLLLHPLPHAGDFFEFIAPLLAAHRTVIAPDYPGYGRSGPGPRAASIAIYAEAMADTLSDRGAGPADLFGFHTGCLVAVEMALCFPRLVRRLVQVDVPYYEPETRRRLLAGEQAGGGFAAAFSYESEKRYSGLRHDCLVLATHSSLLQQSRAAARAIAGCRFREFPEISAPALENGAKTIAVAALEFLDG